MKSGPKFLLFVFCLIGFALGSARGGSIELAKPNVDGSTDYIKSLALALDKDPVRIFEWVRNNIEFTPYFGFKRGAHLTALERQGNDCDSAALLVALLRESGFESSYQYGKIEIPYADCDVNAVSWLAAEKETLPKLLKSAGVSAEDDANKLKVWHVWVKLGATDLAPALKAHATKPKFDFSKIGYSASSLLTAVGGTSINVAGTASATAYTTNIAGKNALRDQLSAYTTELVDYASQTAHSESGLSLLGGRSIVFAKINHLTECVPSGLTMPSSRENWESSDIPAKFCPRFEVTIGGLKYSTYTAELGGRKLTLWFKNGGVELWRDDDDPAPLRETGFDSGVPADVKFLFGYPKEAAPKIYYEGDYQEGVVEHSAAPLSREGKYVVSYGFGGVRDRLIERLRLQADLVDRKFNGESRQLMSENLYVMSLQYLNSLMEMNEIAGLITDTRVHFAFHAGIAGQREVPYVDLPMNLASVAPTRAQPSAAASDALVKRVYLTCSSFWASMLEHVTIEQMVESKGVSTTRMIEKAVELGNPIYLAKSWSDYTGADGASGVRSLLTNYPGTYTTVRDVAAIEKGLRDGGSLLIPKNAAMAYNDYKGTGYMLVSPTDKQLAAPPGDPQPEPYKAWSVLVGISGGMNGGWASSASTPPLDITARPIIDFPVNPASLSESSSWDSTHIADPVDMTNGSFYHTATDLALSGEGVHGLTLIHRYSSARRTADPVGMGKGWSHSYNMQLQLRHPNDFSLSRASVAELAPFAIAIKAITDIYNPEGTAREGVVPALIACWLGDQLIDTRATITLGEQELDFVKLPDGTYAPPPGISATLVNSAGTHTLSFRKGGKFTFRASDGKCTEVADYNNSTGTKRALTITYRTDKKPNRVTDAYGRYIQFDYAGDGRLSGATDSTGRAVRYGLDAQDGKNAFTVEDAAGNFSRYTLDDRNRVTALRDGAGRTIIESDYNKWDQVIAQRPEGLPAREGAMGFAPGMTRNSDADKNDEWLYYDARGRVYASVDAMEALSSSEYDGNNRVIQTKNALGQTNKFAYDRNHEVINVTDALNHTRTIRPASDDSVSWFRSEFNFEGLETTTRYHSFHKPKSVTAPGGITSEFEYDSRGRLKKHRPAAFASGQSIEYFYTPAETTNAPVTKIKAVYPAQPGGSTTSETSHFDACGNLVQFISRRGQKTTFAYDANLRLVQEVRWPGVTFTDASPLGGTPPAGSLIRKLAYDANGNLWKETIDGDGDIATTTRDQVTVYEYDAEGRVLSVIDPEGVLRADYYYDHRGLLFATFDANDAITTTDYDAAKRPLVVHDELYRVFQTQYDALGRPIATVTPRGRVTETYYDTLGRVQKVIDPRDPIYIATTPPETEPSLFTEFTYDNDGREKKLRNRRAKDFKTDYADAARQVTTETPLDTVASRFTRTTRNARGLPETIVEPSSQTINMKAWDNEGRVTLQQHGDGTHAKFTYHTGGLLHTVSEPVNADGSPITSGANPTRVTTRIYDDFDRLSSYSEAVSGQSALYTLAYTYDAVGNLFRVRYPDNYTVGYLYDRCNRLIAVEEWTAPPVLSGTPPVWTTPIRTTSYTYDAAGRLTTTTRPNGTQRVQVYDDAGQLVAITEKRTSGANPMIWARSFRFDEGGHDNIPNQETTAENDRQFVANDGEITQTYTWPAPVSWETLLPSSAATPANDTLTFNDDNQLAAFNGLLVGHDKDGNLRGRPTITDQNNPSYDLDSNFSGIPLPQLNTLDVNAQNSIFSYDSRNRLKSAGGSVYHYNPDGLRTQVTGTAAASSVIDPNGMSRLLTRTVGLTTTRYIWGHGLLHEVAGATVRYYHADQVGSTVAITNAAAEVTARVDYASFGEVVAKRGDTTTPFLFNGASGVETDANGLIYMRARYYHPRLMRFLNADPIRFEGGMNWYAFAGNNPLSFNDPSGFCAEPSISNNTLSGLWAGSAQGVISLAHSLKASVNLTPGYQVLALFAPDSFPVQFSQAMDAEAAGMKQWVESNIVGLTGADNETSYVFAGSKVSGEFGFGILLGLGTFKAPAADPSGARPGSFSSLMSPKEAARYEAYWAQELGGATRQRLQVAPSTQSITDVKLSTQTGQTYARQTIYDQYGRATGVNDFTTHGRPQAHTNPHYHTINSQNWKQGVPHGPAKPGVHPETP